jgi:hypothetical protein
MTNLRTNVTGVATTCEGPVAYDPFPRVPVAGACATPEERL